MGWHPGQVALLPTQNRPDPGGRAQLGDAQPTAVGDQDPGGIAVPVAVLACGGDQALDFFKGQAFAGAALAPRDTGRGRTVPFSVIGMAFCAVSRVIAHTVSHTPNCPIKGRGSANEWRTIGLRLSRANSGPWSSQARQR